MNDFGLSSRPDSVVRGFDLAPSIAGEISPRLADERKDGDVVLATSRISTSFLVGAGYHVTDEHRSELIDSAKLKIVSERSERTSSSLDYIEKLSRWITVEMFSSVADVNEATRIILLNSGFIADPRDRIGLNSTYGDRNESQGTPKLRITAAKLTKKFIHALSPSVLKAEKSYGLDQYLTFKIKRLGHTLSLKGVVPLSTVRNVSLEGFCEAFTIPMVASSFQNFYEVKKTSLNTLTLIHEDLSWLLNWSNDRTLPDRMIKQLNSTTTSDMLTSDEINTIATRIQAPDFVGPISIGSGWNWHSNMIIFIGDFIVYCELRMADKTSGIEIFKLPNRSLITPEIIRKIAKRQDLTSSEMFRIKDVKTELLGKSIYLHEVPPAIVGNCTYTSAQLCLLTYLVIESLSYSRYFVDKRELADLEHRDHWRLAFESTKKIYHMWERYDLELILDEFLKDLMISDSKPATDPERIVDVCLLGHVVKKIDNLDICINPKIKERLKKYATTLITAS